MAALKKKSLKFLTPKKGNPDMITASKYAALSPEERAGIDILLSNLGIPIPDLEKEKRDSDRTKKNNTKKTVPLASYILHVTTTCRLCKREKLQLYIMIPDKVHGAHILRSVPASQLDHHDLPIVKTKKGISTCHNCFSVLFNKPVHELVDQIIKLHKELQL